MQQHIHLLSNTSVGLPIDIWVPSTTFNGVERTNVDKYIVPTTWREIGVGLSGRLDEQSLNYHEFNIEGYPNSSFLDLVKEVKPHQVTLVP
ncbi:hypothetical protein N9Y89_00320 [bacterium]|nr:hypothetical protein [bacterium]